MDGTAILSSFDHYTTFSYGGKTLTFRTCDGLERYTKVLTWDKGYLEFLAYRCKCGKRCLLGKCSQFIMDV